MAKVNLFESMLIIVWVIIGFIGYKMINDLYIADQRQVSWMMLVSIFTWLSLLVLLILAGLMIENRKENPPRKMEKLF